MALDIDKLLGDKETVGEETVSKKTVRGKETVSEETVSSEETVTDKKTSNGTGENLPVAAGGKKPPARKKKGKPRGGNSPVIGNNGLMVEPGDNAKTIGINLKLLNMPDINLNDVDAVAERLGEYFQIYAEADLKPTVVGMAVALNGHSRQWLWGVVHDKPINGNKYEVKLPPEVANLIKKTYILMENQWETYMNSGKINPVSGIFLGKNNFNYQDKTEYVVTPNVQNDNDYDADSIRERYAETPPKRLSDGSDYTDEDESD